MVDYFFSDFPKNGNKDKIKVIESIYSGGIDDRIHSFELSETTSLLGFKGAKSSCPDLFGLTVLASLLGSQENKKSDPSTFGTQSLLNFITKKGVHSYKTFNLNYSDSGLFIIQISGSSEGVGSSISDILKVFKDISDGKISEDDFKRAKNKAEFSFFFKF